MFSFLYSEQKKMRQNATNWLEVADRVHKFRRDQLSAAQGQQLLAAAGQVKTRLKEKADASKLKMAVESLEVVLRQCGGRIYPVSSLVENVEFFLVAAIVILGLRAYFIQPFKIPTNSMWPSYYGMTSETFKAGEEPGLLRRAARLVTLGATNYSVAAPADGEVLLPAFATTYDGTHYSLRPAFTVKTGRSLLVFPTMLHEYTFAVGGERATITVPADFAGDFQGVLDEAFKGNTGSLAEALQASAARNKPLQSSTMRLQGRDVTVYWIPLGRKVHKGEKLLSFDIRTGDLLFVDRFTYNFIPPKVGSGFVFRTENINSPEMLDAAGQQIRQYYVKRLVGLPGDTLEIKPPVLFRNGRAIEGADAFGRNARREGLYPGYTNTAEGLLPAGGTVTVPAHGYFALGDNSPRSKDSRYWGFVPDKDVVGRPLFIYYPLTRRWGPAG